MEISQLELRAEAARVAGEASLVAAQSQAIQNAISASGATFVPPSASRVVPNGIPLRYGQKYRAESVFG